MFALGSLLLFSFLQVGVAEPKEPPVHRPTECSGSGEAYIKCRSGLKQTLRDRVPESFPQCEKGTDYLADHPKWGLRPMLRPGMGLTKEFDREPITKTQACEKCDEVIDVVNVPLSLYNHYDKMFRRFRGDAAEIKKMTLEQNAIRDRTEIPYQCFQKSMERLPPKASTCTEGNGTRQSVDPKRLCHSETYVKATHQAFHDVAKCLQLEPQQLFPIFNHESGFTLNAVGDKDDTCLGQVTQMSLSEYAIRLKNYSLATSLGGDAYNGSTKLHSREDVEDLKLDNLKTKPECADVFGKNAFKPATSVHSCEMVHNPYTCLMYSALTYKVRLKRAEFMLKTYEAQMRAALGKKKWPNADNYKFFENAGEVLNIVADWSYNIGDAASGVYFYSYLKRLQAAAEQKDPAKVRQKVSTVDFVKEFFNNYIGAKYGKDSAARLYVSNLHGSLRTLDEKHGKNETGDLYRKACGQESVYVKNKGVNDFLQSGGAR